MMPKIMSYLCNCQRATFGGQINVRGKPVYLEPLLQLRRTCLCTTRKGRFAGSDFTFKNNPDALGGATMTELHASKCSTGIRNIRNAFLQFSKSHHEEVVGALS